MYKLIIRLLLKYGILKILSAQESFFKVSVLAKKVKLSPELIQLNYTKLSPIANPDIISYKEDNTIYLWFLKKQKRSEKILIPESFLIYKALQSRQDAVFVFTTEPKQVYVLKQKKLLAAYISYDTIDAPAISIVKDEYDLKDLEILSAKEHSILLQTGLEKLAFGDLLAFMRFKVNKESLKKFFIEQLTYPIILLLFTYMFVSYTQGYFLQKKENTLLQKYQTLKTKNTDVKNAIRKHNKEVEKLERFFQKEFVPIGPFKITHDLYKIITPKDKATITFLSIVDTHILIKIKTTDGSIKYLERLNHIPYLRDIVIDSTFNHRNGYKTYAFSMRIKADHE